MYEIKSVLSACKWNAVSLATLNRFVSLNWMLSVHFRCSFLCYSANAVWCISHSDSNFTHGFFFIFSETYQSRVRRASLDYSSSDEIAPPMVDIDYAQKKIIDEYGQKACVIEEPCKLHALRPGRAGAQPDWMDILR